MPWGVGWPCASVGAAQGAGWPTSLGGSTSGGGGAASRALMPLLSTAGLCVLQYCRLPLVFGDQPFGYIHDCAGEHMVGLLIGDGLIELKGRELRGSKTFGEAVPELA